MTSPRALAIASVVVLGAHPVAAQDLSGYRAYTLESSVAAVATISKTQDSDVRSLHVRPARIQELKWDSPYTLRGAEGVDPVQDIIFRFYNGALYQLVVTYDRERMEELAARIPIREFFDHDVDAATLASAASDVQYMEVDGTI